MLAFVSELRGMSILSQEHTYSRGGASEEDQCSEVSGSLVTQSTGGIDQGCNTIGLDGTAGQRATPSSGSTGSFLGLDEFLL